MKPLELSLYAAGVTQLLILTASALVPRVLDWKTELAKVHPFLRRLFWVYGVFIVLTIVSFAVATLLHAPELARGGPLARTVCAVIGTFWFVRLLVQLFAFDARPFLTSAWLVAGYHALTLAFVLLSAVYGWAAFLL